MAGEKKKKKRLETFVLVFGAFISEEFQGLLAVSKLLRKYLGILPNPPVFLGILHPTSKVLLLFLRQ